MSSEMAAPPIYTIGYGAREIDDFIAVLQAYGIAYLIDVRSRPYSRYKPDFSKDQLAAHVERNGIRYVFMGDTLGARPENRELYNEKNKVDYDKLRESSAYHTGIARIKDAFRQQLPVVLMCSEGKPENCHRSRLIGRTLHKADVPVLHIDENDQLISQKDAESRDDKGQLPLFPDEVEPQTSRKRYDVE